jgi:putative ABC transport system permease protein
MKSYIKLALKVLGRRKFFTFISLFGITLTLVVLMVVTAILDNVFAPREPESRFDRVLMVYRLALRGDDSTMSSEPGFRFIEEYVRTLSGTERVSSFSNAQTFPIYKGVTRIDASVKRTDGHYWGVLDFRFLEGRPFTTAEDAAGTRVAVISDDMRDQLFGGAPALGKTFNLEAQQFRVIGVVPSVSIARLAAYADIWLPIGTLSSAEYRRNLMGGFHALVLARSAADFPRLRQEFALKLRNYPMDRKQFHTVNTGLDTTFETFARLVTGNREGDRAPMIVRTVFVVLAVLFMSLPALNLVTLNLSRILERASEIGVRKAFGAPRRSLVWQFVVENVVLTVIGGAVGFVLSIVVLYSLASSDVFPNAQFDVNLRIFAYGMLIAVFFGLFSGVYPAWRMSRLDPVNALRGGVA